MKQSFKIIFLTLLLSVAVSRVCLAGNESISLPGYHTSVYGIYDRVRLFPHDEVVTPPACVVGTMYYAGGAIDQLQICDNTGNYTNLQNLLTQVWELDADSDIYLKDTTSPEVKQVGIGTVAPEAQLHLANDGSILSYYDSVNDSPALTLPALNPGTKLIWYPSAAAFRAGVDDATTPWDDANISSYTFAVGYRTQTGPNPFASAFGYQTQALGRSSLAFGQSTVASGSASLAAGHFTEASGNYSMAFGGWPDPGPDAASNEGAYGDNAMTFGYQTTASDVSFASGNATTNHGLYSMTTGNNSSITGLPWAALVSGENGVADPGYYALVTGRGNRAEGTYSITSGRNSTSAGYNSIALGDGASATSDYSLAIGTNVETNGGTIALGDQAQATGSASTSLGTLTVASALSAVAIGTETQATEEYAKAFGYKTQAAARNSFAAGNNSQTFTSANEASIAIGNMAMANGLAAVALGQNAQANANAAMAVGTNVTVNGVGSVGFNVNPNSRTIDDANTMVVYTDTVAQGAKIAIGTTTPDPAHYMTVEGDTMADAFNDISSRETKKDIVYLNDKTATQLLNELKPVEFNYINDPDEEYRAGFIAEDVPDMLAVPGRKALNSLDFVAALTDVVKQQRRMIEQQRQAIQELKKKINGL